jgi:hypothetical protein
MHQETEREIAQLRLDAASVKKKLDEAKELLGGNTDEGVRGEVQQAQNWMDDLETHFIANITDGRWPPRARAGEAALMILARNHLTHQVAPQVNKVHMWAKQYGSKLTSAG